MNYEDAMNAMKMGRVVKRTGWDGHVRIEGLQMIRVKPNTVPFRFYPLHDDRAATDWVASVPPARSDVSPDIATFLDPVNSGVGRGVDGRADRS